MKHRVNSLILLGLFAVLGSSLAKAAELPRHERLIIHTSHEKLELTAEIADTPTIQQVGLMYRDSLPKRHGMLFIWKYDIDIEMWMKNTYIPLDILFIDAKGIIVHIARDTVPESLTPIGAGRPVRAVLELAGGSCKTLHIDVGDRVAHNRFLP